MSATDRAAGGRGAAPADPVGYQLPRDSVGTDAHQRFRSVRTFSALDGLRALSVLAVIWQHTSGRPGPEFLGKGYFGVDFFFAISGFLITTLLLRERRSRGQFSLRKFYIRRVFRIFPVYYLVLAAYLVLVLLTQADQASGRAFLDHLPAFATYTSNWFIGKTGGDTVTFYFAWSLATEEQFYAFWPPLLALLLALPGRPLPKILSALGILIVVSQAAMAGGSTALPMIILASLALPILLGVALALILDDPRGFALLAPVLCRRWSAPIVFALLAGSLVVNTPEQLTQTLMVLAVGAVTVREGTPLHPALRWAPLGYVGRISYGMYLMHMLCANVVRRVIGQQFGVLLFCLTVLAVVAAASVSFRWFERPLLKLGHRWGRPTAGVSG